MQDTQVRSLGGEDPLEKGMATHCSILAWRIPWMEEPHLWGCKKLDIKEINPEYSLEGPMLKLKLQSLGHLM